MGKNVLSVLVLGVALSSAAFGSGFKCESDEGIRVKLFNHVSPENGTRTPAKLIISSEEEGTLLARSTGSITKHNRLNTVQYVVGGNQRLGADKAILQISFKEGEETLEAGETADGQLILVADGDRTVIDLVCARYLKNE